MSYVSQFLAGSSGSSGGGSGKPIGALELFAPNMGDLITLPDNSKYLKGGVIGKSSDYPNVPSVFLKQLSPMTKVSDIGSGGVWRAMTIDTLGFPLVLQSAIYNLNSYVYRITGVSATSGDVQAIGGTVTNYPGSWGLSLAVTGNTIIIGREFTQSPYSNGPIHLYNFAAGGTSAGPQTYTSTGNWQAVAASITGAYVVIPRGASHAMYGTDYNNAATISMSASLAWTSAACNSTRFVAIASGSTTMNYSNSLTVSSWLVGTMPSAAQWISVASNGSGFMAIAANGTTAASSTNGITWASSTLPLNQNWSSICWSSVLGKYIAVAKGSNIGATTVDGTSWSTIVLPKTANWESVVYSPVLNRLFICASDGTGVWSSFDGGVSWAEKTMPRPISFERIEYTNGGFNAYTFASGTPTTNYPYNPITARSTNGTDWIYNNAIPTTLTYAESPARSVGTSLAFTSASSNSMLVYSSANNGSTWSSVTAITGFSYNFRSCDIAYNGTRYVAPMSQYFETGNSVWLPAPWILHSTTLTTGPWTLTNIGITAYWRCLINVGTLFIMAGYDANGNIMIARSADGLAWATASYPSTNIGTADVHIENDTARNLIVISAGSSLNGVFVSADNGLTWQIQTKAYGGLIQNGSRYSSASTTTNNTYVDAQAVNLYASYTHSLNIKSNTVTPITGYAAPLFNGGNAYFMSSGAVYVMDSTMWVDNRGSAFESSGQAYYYMRVN